MRQFLAVFVLLCGLSGQAEAVTLRDLIDLSKQGLSDDLLIALVEAEKSVFHLNASDVKNLKAQGLSDRLLIHLLQTPALRPEPEPRLLIADRRAPEPAIVVPERVIIVDRVETVAVPVYVSVPAPRRSRDRDRDRDRDDERKDKTDDDSRRHQKPESTQYWGYGGKLRPDAWGQPKGKGQK